jgi:hypothetical protein
MLDSFGQAYGHLTDFIQSNPEIEIHESVTSIPDNVRAEFYRRFNTVRDAFVEKKFSLVLERARMLQENYAKAEGQVSSLIEWEDTPEVSRVQRFLRNVSDSMARELFDPLFDLLKGRDSLESFEQKGAERIDEHWPVLFRGGYEKWAVLSLARLLEPEKALRVDVRPLKHGERAKSADHAPWDDAPDPEESHRFFFTQPRNAILTVPDLVLRSAKLNRFVGIRSEFREGLYKALNPSQKREWLSLETDLLFLLESGLTLIYLSEEAQQIALIADVNRFCRPDMIMWCVDSLRIAQPEAQERANTIDQQLNPRIGTFVVATDAWPKLPGVNETADSRAQIDEQSLRVRILNTGFDASRLLPIVDALEPVNLHPEMT